MIPNAGPFLPEPAPDPASEPLASRVARAVGSRAFLVAVLVLAAALRVAHVLALHELPLDVLVIDSAIYDLWAERIAGGDWLGSGVFYQDPLYPYFLAALYKAFGRDVLLVRLVQAGLGVGTCAFVAAIGTRAAGRIAGNLAALLLAVFVPSIFHEWDVDKTALGIFLMTAALALGLRPGLRSRAAAGAVLGLAALTRGNLLLIAPLAALAIALEAPVGARLGEGWRAWVAERLRAPSTRAALAFCAGFALVLAPVTLRNHHFSGEWIPTTYGAGAVFYTGNNPANSSGAFEHVPFVRSFPEFEEGDFRAAAEARVGRPLSPKEISAFWFREALRHVGQNPGFAAAVMLRKVALFVGDYEMPDAWDLYFLARYSAVLRLPLLSMAGLLALATLGIALAWRESRVVRLVTGLVAAYALAVVAFFVFARYRVYAAPGLAVLGGAGLAEVGRRVRSGRTRALLPAAGLAVLVGLVSLSGIGTPPKGENLGNYVRLANLYFVKGDAGAAARLLEEALARDPRSPEVLCGLGRMRLEQHDPAGASDALRRCLAVDPTFANGWHFVGIAELVMGNRTAAEEAFRRQLAIVPGHEDSARWLARMGR